MRLLGIPNTKPPIKSEVSSSSTFGDMFDRMPKIVGSRDLGHAHFRVASEEVILHLISSKCLPILLYGLESLPLYQYQLNSLDFVINIFFMKLFKTTDMYTIATLQEMFGFELPSLRIARRTVKFEMYQ